MKVTEGFEELNPPRLIDSDEEESSILPLVLGPEILVLGPEETKSSSDELSILNDQMDQLSFCNMPV